MQSKSTSSAEHIVSLQRMRSSSAIHITPLQRGKQGRSCITPEKRELQCREGAASAGRMNSSAERADAESNEHVGRDGPAEMQTKHMQRTRALQCRARGAPQLRESTCREQLACWQRWVSLDAESSKLFTAGQDEPHCRETAQCRARTCRERGASLQRMSARWAL